MTAAPISLYLDLEEGQSPDLEVVARAAIAWNALLKEVIELLDPSLDVRVEYVSGTKGSATIDSIVKAFSKVAKEHPFIVAPLVAIATAFAMAPANHLGEDLTEYVLEQVGHEDGMSDADAQKIAEKVVAVQRNQVAQEHKREMYRQLEREPAIKGVGATPIPTERPAKIVTRPEFGTRADMGRIEESTTDSRTIWKYDYPVVLVRPVLKAEERRWRFQHGDREFSATMKDKEFLDVIGSGHTGLELGEGLEMRIDLRIKEEKVGGVWVIKEEAITRVVWPIMKRQMTLQFSPN
jgi:hypothetical protein